MSTHLQEKIEDLGRKELKQILEKESLFGRDVQELVLENMAGSLEIDRKLGKALQNALGWLADQDAEFSDELSDVINMQEQSSRDAIPALDPVSGTVIILSVASVIRLGIKLWFKVWQTKMMANNPSAEYSLKVQEGKVEIRAKDRSFPSIESASFDLNRLHENLGSSDQMVNLLRALMEGEES